MTQRISRRTLLSGAIKTGIGLAICKELTLGELPAFALTSAQAPAKNDTRFQPAFAELDKFIAAHMADAGAPGLMLTLATRDGLLRASGYGLADIKSGARVKPDTLFEIGSVSKSVVALALLQMRDEGKFDPAKPITTYLPWLKIESKYRPITGHHLLSHTSGLPGGVSLELIGLDQTLWTGFAPGEHFLYSNIGYNLLGLIMEAIDRQPMATVLRRRVLAPLGMNSSDPVISNIARPRMAVGYAPMFGDRPFPLRGSLGEAAWMEFGEGAGSVASTATDMAAYVTMLLNRGRTKQGRIVNEETFKLMTTPVIKSPFRGEDASYTYGLWVSDLEGRTQLRHTGGMVAFSSALHVDLNSGIGAFASANANLAGYRPVAVAKYALDLLRASMEKKDLPAPPSTTTNPDLVSDAKDFAGAFTSADGTRLVLSSEGGKLWLEAGNQRQALERTGRDRFIVKHPDFAVFVLEFGREKDIVVEAFHGPRWFTSERYAGPKTFEYPKEWDAYAGNYRCDSPWFGNIRVFVRKGRLIAGGGVLTPLGDGAFRPGADEWSPERVVFGAIINGRAAHLRFSGVQFHRTSLP
jgi:CubicO group peptidase (beta-lactamase class C family)